eukprot:7752980-Pyramimonas_sp.AAC.1
MLKWVKHMLKWVKHMLKWVNHMLKWVNLVTVSNQGRIQFSQTAASGIAKVQCYSPFLRRSAEALGSLPCVASRAIPVALAHSEEAEGGGGRAAKED